MEVAGIGNVRLHLNKNPVRRYLYDKRIGMGYPPCLNSQFKGEVCNGAASNFGMVMDSRERQTGFKFIPEIVLIQVAAC